jgi:SAM-dependent methyltransferase
LVDFTPELLAAAEESALQWNCNGALHKDDHILHYVITYSPRSIEHGVARGVAEFFERGALDARQVEELMARLGHGEDSAVLEFASGYGRVTRHLRLPKLTSCDIHPEAVEFLRSKMNVQAILSASDPAMFECKDRYDFIFVLSLFSHLPENLYAGWLKRLYDLLRPGGHLMFTANGETSAQKEPLLGEALDPKTGFGFIRHTEQTDLDFSIYGSTISVPKFVEKQIATATNGKGVVESFEGGSWWLLQDQWVVSKPLAESEPTLWSRVKRLWS